MKTLNKCILALSALCCLTACDNDGDKVILSGFETSELIATQSKVVLSNETSAELVLSLAWTVSDLQTNNENYGVAEAAQTNTLQISMSNDFSSCREYIITENSVSYIGSQLNSVALLFGIEPGAGADLYMRIKSFLANNVETLYSNVVSVNVTPYQQLSYLYMPKDGWTDFSWRLCSKSSNGEYIGFIQASQWANFKFCTTQDINSGVVYGTPSDGTLGNLSTADDMWNIWFDEGGYFYMTASTNSLSWTKTAISSITATGEFNSWSVNSDPLTYDEQTGLWSATLNIGTTLYGLQLLLNESWSFKIVAGDKSGELNVVTDGKGNNIELPSTGVYTLTLDLNDPADMKYTLIAQ